MQCDIFTAETKWNWSYFRERNLAKQNKNTHFISFSHNLDFSQDVFFPPIRRYTYIWYIYYECLFVCVSDVCIYFIWVSYVERCLPASNPSIWFKIGRGRESTIQTKNCVWRVYFHFCRFFCWWFPFFWTKKKNPRQQYLYIANWMCWCSHTSQNKWNTRAHTHTLGVCLHWNLQCKISMVQNSRKKTKNRNRNETKKRLFMVWKNTPALACMKRLNWTHRVRACVFERVFITFKWFRYTDWISAHSNGNREHTKWYDMIRFNSIQVI